MQTIQTKYKEYLLIISILLIGIISFVLSIIALNTPYIFTSDGREYHQSIKQIYEAVPNNFPSIFRHTAGMAYIGSIVTICGSIVLILFGGALTYTSMVIKKDIFSNKIIIVSVVAIIIILSLAIASVVTASNITNGKWVHAHWPKFN